MEDYAGRYGPDAFVRPDESEDALFYERDRFVGHVDSRALETIEDVIENLVVEEKPKILDLMASWDSHVRESLGAVTVGLGLNERELAANRALTDYTIHDINADPRLPYPDGAFDAVICSLSIDYVTRPGDVFREVGRVLAPGGMFLVVFSNRFFPQKAVRIWQALDEDDRVALVREFFETSGVFGKTGLFVSKNLPRPDDDKYTHLGIPSDPVYAVYADRLGAPPKRRPLPAPAAGRAATPAHDSPERLDPAATETRCPHCGGKLSKLDVPQTPFTEWPGEYHLVCLDDECPYFLRGWETMGKQGNIGSFRFMYDPFTGRAYPLPVMDKNSLKDTIRRDD
jgi:SAM-dependent methyltransferase